MTTTSGIITELNVLKHTNAKSLAWSPSGKKLAIGGDRSFRVWDPEHNNKPKTYSALMMLSTDMEKVAWSLDWSPDGSKVAVAFGDKSIRVWSVESGVKSRVKLPGDAMGPWKGLGSPQCFDSLSWSEDGRIATTGDGRAQIWNGRNDDIELVLNQHRTLVHRIAWDPSSRRVATGDVHGRCAAVWDAASGALVTEFREHGGSVDSVQFSCDGNRLLTSSEDGNVRIFDIQSETLIRSLKHDGRTSSATWCADDAIVFSTCGDQVWIWSLKEDIEPETICCKSGYKVYEVAVNKYSTKLAVRTQEGSVHVFNIADYVSRFRQQ
ncbi:MAG: hypothetical protein AAF138_01930 [Planctomycetota bacterium]